MSDENSSSSLRPWIDPELEARIVALVLGEASDFEREELERLISEDSDLAAYRRRIESVHGLIENIAAPAANEDATTASDLQLPTAMRDQLLAVFDSETSTEQAAPAAESADGSETTQPVSSESATENAEEPRLLPFSRRLRTGLAIAALAVGMAIVGKMMMPMASYHRVATRESAVPTTDSVPMIGRMFRNDHEAESYGGVERDYRPAEPTTVAAISASKAAPSAAEANLRARKALGSMNSSPSAFYAISGEEDFERMSNGSEVRATRLARPKLVGDVDVVAGVSGYDEAPPTDHLAISEGETTRFDGIAPTEAGNIALQATRGTVVVSDGAEKSQPMKGRGGAGFASPSADPTPDGSNSSFDRGNARNAPVSGDINVEVAGEAAQKAGAKMFAQVDGGSAESQPFGIQMKSEPEVVEFEGFINYGHNISRPAGTADEGNSHSLRTRTVAEKSTPPALTPGYFDPDQSAPMEGDDYLRHFGTPARESATAADRQPADDGKRRSLSLAKNNSSLPNELRRSESEAMQSINERVVEEKVRKSAVLPDGFSTRLKGAEQGSDGSLLASEQLGAGGHDTVRGFEARARTSEHKPLAREMEELEELKQIGAVDGTVALGAGGDALVSADGNGKLSVADGELKAQGNVYSRAGKNQGMARSSGETQTGGRVDSNANGVTNNGEAGIVMADAGDADSDTKVGGIIDGRGLGSQPGETVVVLGEELVLGKSADTRADGEVGGAVIIGSADETTTIRATSGSQVAANGRSGSGGGVVVAGTENSMISVDGSINATGATTGGMITVNGGDESGAASGVPNGSGSEAAGFAGRGERTASGAIADDLLDPAPAGRGGNATAAASEGIAIDSAGNTIVDGGANLATVGPVAVLNPHSKKVTGLEEANKSQPEGATSLYAVVPENLGRMEDGGLIEVSGKQSVRYREGADEKAQDSGVAKTAEKDWKESMADGDADAPHNTKDQTHKQFYNREVPESKLPELQKNAPTSAMLGFVAVDAQQQQQAPDVSLATLRTGETSFEARNVDPFSEGKPDKGFSSGVVRTDKELESLNSDVPKEVVITSKFIEVPDERREDFDWLLRQNGTGDDDGDGDEVSATHSALAQVVAQPPAKTRFLHEQRSTLDSKTSPVTAGNRSGGFAVSDDSIDGLIASTPVTGTGGANMAPGDFGATEDFAKRRYEQDEPALSERGRAEGGWMWSDNNETAKSNVSTRAGGTVRDEPRAVDPLGMSTDQNTVWFTQDQSAPQTTTSYAFVAGSTKSLDLPVDPPVPAHTSHLWGGRVADADATREFINPTEYDPPEIPKLVFSGGAETPENFTRLSTGIAEKKPPSSKVAGTYTSEYPINEQRKLPFKQDLKPQQTKSPVPEGLDEINTSDEPFSTFSLHVSDVSFTLAKTALDKGEWPDAERIRVEEFVNAFDYGDPLPSLTDKVACQMEQTIHPFLQQRNFLRLSMRTAAAGRSQATPLNLTLVLDHSGSMERHDRQQTVQRAFATLTDQLTENDTVTVIGFARQPRLLVDRAAGNARDRILAAAANTPSEGGTHLESALHLAFEKAREQVSDNAQNRVILLTDGAANLGDANPVRLAQKVHAMREAGIAFDAAGIGANGLNDEILEALTRKGDGRYYLLDQPDDADEGFARQIAGALRPAAMNVKVQIEFNPERVASYKLLGFEKHRLKKEDFRNDKVDAAEIAAEEAGVAVYQFEPLADGKGDVGTAFLRFRDMSTGEMVEKRWPIAYAPDAPRPDQASPKIRLATVAALFAAKLKGDALGASVDLAELTQLLNSLPSHLRELERVKQLHNMIEKARNLDAK